MELYRWSVPPEIDVAKVKTGFSQILSRRAVPLLRHNLPRRSLFCQGSRRKKTIKFPQKRQRVSAYLRDSFNPTHLRTTPQGE